MANNIFKNTLIREEWWATLESNQACVSARELQSPATPCGLSPTLDTKKIPKVEKIYDLENPQSTKKAFDLYRGRLAPLF